MSTYTLRLGPLAFECPADAIDRTLGEGSETVGRVITPADPRPRPITLTLPVRGAMSELDPRAFGYRLRDQVEQLLENARYLAGGLYLHWEVDPAVDAWLAVRGGKLSEDDDAVVFGEWNLELEGAYVVGKPNRARPGRRLELVDRRTGLVSLDTRRTLFAVEHAAQALPARPLIVPGNIASTLLSRNRPPTVVANGPSRVVPLAGGGTATRRLWTELAAVDGDVASFLPATDVAFTAGAEVLELEDLGSVRAWDTTSSTIALTGDTLYTNAGDLDPTAYGWTRVLGQPRGRATPLAIGNGVCRLVWLGAAAGQGLAVESWDATLNRYIRLGRVGAATGVAEVTIVELTPERAVVEWRGAERALRAILQRGWYGPRLEAYTDDPVGTARLEVILNDGAAAASAQTPAWVERLDPPGVVVETNLVQNPSLETNATGWSTTTANATVNRITTDGYVGTSCLELVCTNATGTSISAKYGETAGNRVIAVTPGTQVAARAAAKRVSAVGQMRLFIRWLTAAGGTISDDFAPAAIAGTGAWQELTHAATAPATAAFAALGVQLQGLTAGQAATLRADAAIVELGTLTPPAYFDGASGALYKWSGTAHASTSQKLDHVPRILLVAKGRDGDASSAGAMTLLSGTGIAYTAPKTVVAQIGTPIGPTAAELASLAVVDAQPVPVLVQR